MDDLEYRHVLVKCRIKNVNIEIIEYKYDGHTPFFVAKKGNAETYTSELDHAKHLFWLWLNENIKLL